MEIVILIYNRFTALDAIGPYEVLSRLPGAKIKFVAPTKGDTRTDVGTLGIVVDYELGDIDKADVLVVAGGPGARDLLDDDSVNEWLRAIDQTTTWTTSVCTGSLMLAAAGLLDDTEAACHWSAMNTLSERGAKPVPDRVVFAGKRVTAAGVSSGIDMALALSAKITNDQVAQVIQLGIEYDPQPPFDSGSVDKAPKMVLDIAKLAMASS